MAYQNESHLLSIVPKSTAVFTAEDLSAANAVYGGYLVMKQCRIKRFVFYVTTALNTVAAAVVVVKRRPTYNSSSGEITLGTINLPNGTAAGSVVYKDISPVTLYPGDELSFEQTGQAATAGGGFYGVELEDDPEVASNQSKMVAST